jgi:hypothetical protein
MVWSLIKWAFGEFYRRFMSDLDSFQTIRVIDTGEIVPDIERGKMHTYQLPIYNVSKFSPISNCRAKMSIRGEEIGYKVEVDTVLPWYPNKGSVTINRGDSEWLNLATVRPPQEGDLWSVTPKAEIIFPTESGVLNPATVRLTPINQNNSSNDYLEEETITRQSLPYPPGFLLRSDDDIQVSSSNRLMRHFDLSINRMNEDIYLSAEPNRKRLTSKITTKVLNLPEMGLGKRVKLDRSGDQS